MASDETRTSLRRLPGCAELAAETLDALAGGARREEFAAAAALVEEGAPAPGWYAVLERGAIQLSRLDVEADEILDVLEPGDVLDAGPAGAPAPFRAVAAEPARCLLVPRTDVVRHRAALAPLVGAGIGNALLVRRARDLLTGPPATCDPATTVSEAGRLMAARRIGSIVVVGADGQPEGIVTDRDLAFRVVAEGRSLDTPVSGVMSRPLVSIEADRPAFDALLEMTRRTIRHVGVTDGGRLAGVLSSRDVVQVPGSHPVALARDAEAQVTIDGLAAVAARVPAVTGWLVNQRVGALDLGRIGAELNDRLVRRAVALVEDALAAEGLGRPPVAYSWLAAGSEGRREQTLRTDQDNGLVYANPAEAERDRAATYFARLADRVTAALTALGFPRCDGDFMASNPRWCQPASAWQNHFQSWMSEPSPAHVLLASLFFDIRPVAGAEEPGRALWAWVCARSPGHALFHGYMARAAVERHVPLGFLGGFVVERAGAHRDALDIKARGVFPVTQAMRVYALSLGIASTNTVERLAEAGAAGAFTPAEVAEVRDAYEVICRIRLARQLECLEAGRPPDNFVTPERLSKGDRVLLKEAFRSVGWLQRHVEERFRTALIG